VILDDQEGEEGVESPKSRSGGSVLIKGGRGKRRSKKWGISTGGGFGKINSFMSSLVVVERALRGDFGKDEPARKPIEQTTGGIRRKSSKERDQLGKEGGFSELELNPNYFWQKGRGSNGAHGYRRNGKKKKKKTRHN